MSIALPASEIAFMYSAIFADESLSIDSTSPQRAWASAGKLLSLAIAFTASITSRSITGAPLSSPASSLGASSSFGSVVASPSEAVSFADLPAAGAAAGWLRLTVTVTPAGFVAASALLTHPPVTNLGRPALSACAKLLAKGCASLPFSNAVMTAPVLAGMDTSEISITSYLRMFHPSSPSALFPFGSNSLGLKPWLMRSAPNSTSVAASCPSAVSAMAHAVFTKFSFCSSTFTILPMGASGKCCHRSGAFGSTSAPLGSKSSPSRSVCLVVRMFSNFISDLSPTSLRSLSGWSLLPNSSMPPAVFTAPPVMSAAGSTKTSLSADSLSALATWAASTPKLAASPLAPTPSVPMYALAKPMPAPVKTERARRLSRNAFRRGSIRLLRVEKASGTGKPRPSAVRANANARA